MTPPPAVADPAEPDRVPSGVAVVTGATGFVGSHIASALSLAGWRLRCMVRATSDTRWLAGLSAETVVADLARDADLVAAVAGAALVVHAAGLTRAIRPLDFTEVNAGGTERLAQACIAAGVPRFVLISSLAARGPDRVGEDGTDRPETAYGRSKLEAERRLTAVAREANGSLHVVMLRPAGVYGPRDRDLLPLFKMARRGFVVVPAGDGLVQPVFVGDVADATVHAARLPIDSSTHPGAGDDLVTGPFSIAGDEVRSWTAVAEDLGVAVGQDVRVLRLPASVFLAAALLSEAVGTLRVRPPALDRRRARDLALRSWTCDPTPAVTGLGWRPAVPLAEGLDRTVRWYREQGWLAD